MLFVGGWPTRDEENARFLDAPVKGGREGRREGGKEGGSGEWRKESREVGQGYSHRRRRDVRMQKHDKEEEAGEGGREGGRTYLLHCFWERAQQLQDILLGVRLGQCLDLLMKQISDFLEEMRGVSSQDGGWREEGGGVETMLLELVLLMVVQFFELLEGEWWVSVRGGRRRGGRGGGRGGRGGGGGGGGGGEVWDGGDGFEEGGEDGVGPLDVVEEEPEEGEEEVGPLT